MKLFIDSNDATHYRRFIQIRGLPQYQFRGHVCHVPDEYAALLGLAPGRKVDAPYDPSPFLFDYQAGVAALAIRRRKFAVFADCGLGKTLILAEFAKHAIGLGNRTLLVSPLMVIPQTVAELRRFYGDAIPTEVVQSGGVQAWLNGSGARLGVTNYEAFKNDLSRGNLGALILDECFPPGTLVDCVADNGMSTRCRIETLSPGDRIRNASGVDVVLKAKRKAVPYAVAFTAGARVTCSPNHPVFTQRGWVCAQDLEPGDSVLQTTAAVRMLRSGVHSEGHAGAGEILRSILLSEMANVAAGACGEAAYAGCEAEARPGEGGMAGEWQPGSGSRNAAGAVAESNDEPRCAATCVADTEGDEPQTFRAWWQWDGIDASADDLAECTWSDVGGGICLVSGPASSRVSHALQARLGERRDASLHRSGWTVALLPEGCRRQEGCDAGFVRVERLEVLEPGHPDLERFRDADGLVYFYDLEAERHPSFSVSGLLVHNSSMLKSHYGRYGTAAIELGRGLEWKLALTGTPAPNDRIEFANHAVFLDVHRTVNEFLAKYFVNRGETANRWELMPHALRPFYRDLSHWCIFLSNPATYGWEDNCETLPPIDVEIHHIDDTPEQRKAIQKTTGTLIGGDLGGIGSRGKIGQIAKGSYNGERIATNKPGFIRRLAESFGERSSIIWCKYDDEQRQIEEAIPAAASIGGWTPHGERMRIVDDFKAGRTRTLISKPKILGFGLNLQVCTRMVFSGLQDSYEEYYQAVKRANRYGSTEPLGVHIPVTETEYPMVENVLRKASRVAHDTAEQESLFKEMSLAFAS